LKISCASHYTWLSGFSVISKLLPALENFSILNLANRVQFLNSCVTNALQVAGGRQLRFVSPDPLPNAVALPQPKA
jgi:hypothetical protein